jgi:hypothetical protein
MRPANYPALAWVHAAESAVVGGHGIANFWGWARDERTKVLLAALEAMPEGRADASEVTVEEYQVCWEAAYGAVCEVITDRRRKKKQRRDERHA